jgi:hypothetical protein
MVKLEELCGSSVTFRCQLANRDLETLISITNDEDLANIIDEYEHASLKLTHPLKIKAILSQPKSSLKVSPDLSSSSSNASFSAAVLFTAMTSAAGRVVGVRIGVSAGRG